MNSLKWMTVATIALVASLACQDYVSAQPAFNPGPGFGPGGGGLTANNGPAVSPYINMLRGGNPATNYYGIVRPEQNLSSSMGNMQQQYNSLGMGPSANSFITDMNTPLPALVTGRRGGFQTNYRYFQNQYMMAGSGGYGMNAYGGVGGMNRGGMGMGGMGMGGMGMGGQSQMLTPGAGMNVPVAPARGGRGGN